MKKHTPIRMCIVCKNRFEQKSLYRFQIQKGEIVSKIQFGRSLYICNQCIFCEEKDLQKTFSKVYKDFHTKISQENLKEIFLNGKN